MTQAQPPTGNAQPGAPQQAPGASSGAQGAPGASPGGPAGGGGPRAAAPAGSTGATESQVLFSGTARHSASLVSYLKWVAVCLLGGVAAYLLKDLEFISSRNIPVWVLVLAGIPGIVIVYLRVATTKYTVDHRRVETEEGILTRRVDSLELWRVLDLQYEQSLLDRMTGNATIRLISTDQTNPTLELRGMPGHRPLFNELREAVQNARHGNRPMELVGGGGGEGLENMGENMEQ